MSGLSFPLSFRGGAGGGGYRYGAALEESPHPNPSPQGEGLTLRVAGYAAIFHVEDRGGDVIEPGAFVHSLAALQPGTLPLLWQHNPLRRIGTVTYAAEDRKGLRVIASLTGEGAALARRDWHGALSFGYRVRASEGERPRRLQRLDLAEVSLVVLPMQTLARVHRLAG